MGLDCSEFLRKNTLCKRRHVCSNDGCRRVPDSSHRAIQHPPKSLCEGHKERMEGMNHLYPEPLTVVFAVVVDHFCGMVSC